MMKISRLLLLLFFLFIEVNVHAQLTGIAINDNNAAPDTSAVLDISVNTASAKRGILIPRITTTQRNAIYNPANSLLIFNTTTNQYEYNSGTSASPLWQALSAGSGGSSSSWSLTGNSGTSPSTNFIGTTDGQGLTFKINNTTAGYLGLSGSSYATSFGVSSNATYQSTAIGASANASSANVATAIGYSSTAGTYRSTAVGASAQATTNNEATAIGYNSLASGYQSVAIGSGAQATSNNQAAAFGASSLASSYQSTAVGTGAQATSNNQTSAFGAGAKATGYQSTALGTSTQATASNSTAIGANTIAAQNNSIILGDGSHNSLDVGIGTAAPLGRLHIYESSGNAGSATSGSVVIEHGNSGGTSSIVFPSAVNKGSDYAYITYSDDASGNGSTNENSLLKIGVENDVANSVYQDDIAIMPSGNLGVNTTTPQAKMDVNGNFKLGSNGSVLSDMIKTSFTYNPPSISSGNQYTFTTTISGASANASVIINPRSSLAAGLLIQWCRISSSNTLTVALYNASGSSINIGSTTFDVTVINN